MCYPKCCLPCQRWIFQVRRTFLIIDICFHDISTRSGASLVHSDGERVFELGNRDFDDSLLQRIAEISYENDVEDIPSPPDVSHYLVPEVSRGSC